MNPQPNKESFSLASPFRGTGGEKLLQYIWQFGYFNSSSLTTTEGEVLSILAPGTMNPNQGPDFTAARIRIGATTFFGTVEVHLRTSDWEKHQHQTDAQYRNVILHVVLQHDKDLHNNIPVLELQPRISALLLERYAALMHADTFIPCSASVGEVKEMVWTSWKERLLVERLLGKSEYILRLLHQSNDHWEETLWWLLARNFGMKLNSDAFEAIARSIPLMVVGRHKASLHQLEALLLGQANLLQDVFEDPYPRMLQREYHFLKKKWQLRPSSVPVVFLRLRPVNFPTVRLAQLAAFLHQSTHLFSLVLEAKDLAAIKEVFQVTANDFWHYHYTLDKPSPFKKKTLGEEMSNNIIINTVIPLLFAYGLHHKEEKHNEKALRWLENLPEETNTITKGFSHLGLPNRSAFDSQAYIELKNRYCSQKRCLECAVGNDLLKKGAWQRATLPGETKK